MIKNECKTILLVEDEAIIALAEKRTLEKNGYSVITAITGEEAIDLVEQNQSIDLILMDIDLGTGIDGTQTAEKILNLRTIPVVFLSSHTEPEIVEKTEEITSYGYVVKNSGNTVLLASIKMAFKLFNAQEHHLNSEIKQKAMISNISDVLGIVSVDGILKYKSRNIEKWFGWKPGDLLGTDFRKTIHPEDLERVEKKFNSLLLIDNNSDTVEYRFKCKDGIYKWVELTAVNCVNNSAIDGVLINYHNITERKKIEHDLIDSEKLHRLLADNVTDVIWTMDFSGRFTYVSPSVYKLRGFTSAEVMQQSINDVLTPESLAVMKPFLDTGIENSLKNLPVTEFRGELEQVRKDGSTVWTEVTISGMKNDEGVLISILGITRNISERKRNDAALRESEEKYRLLVEHSSDLIWNIDATGRFIYISPSWKRVTGYEPEFLTETLFQSLVHPDDLEFCVSYLKNVLEMKEIQNSPEYRVRHSDNTWHLHAAIGTPVIGSDGRSISMVGVSRDITKRRLAEEKIHNLLNEKELILKEVHHRVKNNMSTILSLMTLQMDLNDDPLVKGILFDAAGRIQSMMVLYDKLYRSEYETMLNLKGYFTSLVEEIISIFPQKDSIKIKMQIDDIVLSTKIISPLGIIINELITNSIKYAFSNSKTDNTISLTVVKKDEFITVEYHDNGKGLPESISFKNSTGFGMQLVSLLTDQIRGKIKIERGNGTKFILEFQL